MKERFEKWIKYKMKILHPTLQFLVEFVFVASSAFLATDMFWGLPIKCNGAFVITMDCVWVASLICKGILFWKSRLTYREFRKMELSEKLSSAMLKVEQRTNAYKTRHVLQITYGSIPQWHPFDYQDNVLVYDVHEQIRTILLELKNAIISITPELDADAVTVDLVYCYPDTNYDGKLPADKNKLDEWRLITSRDGSSMNYKVHDFLSSRESFYFHLDQNNYVFFNDKSELERYYIPSGKDQEYGRDGSVVGLSINVKNDVPESVLVKAMLTISTYGRKLNEKGDPVKEDVYKKLFKKNILNGYKSLLESELSQMYIRHMIREGGMCPRSGVVIKSEEPEKKEKTTTLPKRMYCTHRCSRGVCKHTKNLCKQMKDNKSS